MVDGMSEGPAPRPGASATRSLATCPFCGGRLVRAYDGLADRLQTTARTFAIDECTSCQAGVLNPAPIGDVSAFYPTNYLSGERGEGSAPGGGGGEAGAAGTGGGLSLEKWYRYNQYRFDFRLLERASGLSIGQTPSYVDLGCGSGERMAYAGERGCARAMGVDKFDFVKSTVRGEAEIVNSDILEFAPAARFAAVSLFHVLEHLDDPASVLAHIRDEIIAPDGHLIIQVPNYGSVERRLFGGRWFGLDVPRHYWHFNQTALCRLLDAHGYRAVAAYRRNAALHPVSIAPSISPDVDVQRIWVRHAKGVAYRRRMMLLWSGLTLLTIPQSVGQSAFGQGSMLTVVAARA